MLYDSLSKWSIIGLQSLIAFIWIVFETVLYSLLTGAIAMLVVGVNVVFGDTTGITDSVTGVDLGYWHAVGLYALGLFIMIFSWTFIFNVIFEVVSFENG